MWCPYESVVVTWGLFGSLFEATGYSVAAQLPLPDARTHYTVLHTTQYSSEVNAQHNTVSS